MHWEETVSWPAVGSPRTGGLTKLSNYKADISTLYEKKLGEKKKRQEEKDKWYDSISLMQMSMDVLFGDLLNSMSKETDWEQTL